MFAKVTNYVRIDYWAGGRVRIAARAGEDVMLCARQGGHDGRDMDPPLGEGGPLRVDARL